MTAHNRSFPQAVRDLLNNIGWKGVCLIKVVSWNVGKRDQPWHELAQMARYGDADLALLQEAGSPPGDLVDCVEYVDRGGYPSFGQVFVTAKVESGVMIQATLG